MMDAMDKRPFGAEYNYKSKCLVLLKLNVVFKYNVNIVNAIMLTILFCHVAELGSVKVMRVLMD